MEKKSKIPDNAVVLLVGVSGSGKSTFAKKAFENKALVVSSDECRKELCGDEMEQSVNIKAFELFYKKIEEGIAQGKRVIADATNLDKYSRELIYDIAKKNNVPIYAIMFNVNLQVIKRQNKMRSRVVPDYAIDRMFKKMKIAYNEICEEVPCENIIDIIIPSKIKPRNKSHVSR